MPRPIFSPSQRNVSGISHNTEPFVENHRGVNLYKLENLGTGINQTVSLSFSVDVYAVETEITPLSVRPENAPLFEPYTQSTNLIPADNEKIISNVNSAIGRERNPYLKAKLLYDWIIANINISENAFGVSEDMFDPCAAALLYTAMARTAGIPCIPVAGVLINSSGQAQRHYWNEFWLNDFGWVPVDVVMGAGAVPQSFITREDNLNYYFGNLDNRRIAFSRGELNLSRIESRGRLVPRPNSYSLQNIWEEATGGLESYTSFWGDIIITGIYAQ
jgi:hypothetical protein